MRIVVLGNGYIGSAFDYNKITREQFDVIKDSITKLYVLLQPYDVIINTIGITDTIWTEKQENLKTTLLVNSYFVGHLSEFCEKYDKKLIHISTGDLYGNNFNWSQNTEDSNNLDYNTNYRLSKGLAEKLCNPNDTILRIRLPFDNRKHPKNLLYKSRNFTKFYQFQNCYTYVPDLVSYIKSFIIPNDLRGIYNICQNETASLLYLWRNVIKKENLQNIDIHNNDDPNIISELNNIHIHNDNNCEKIRQYHPQTNLEVAWLLSYAEIQKELD